tara:strand:- start:1120 stop:1686 length:567 start_codon:yes stop_codon:yes gene_type:complete
MTLPTTTILPLHSEKIKEGGAPLDAYMRELVFSLQRQYEDMAHAINGDTKRSVDVGNVQWKPVLRDSANSATTFTYDHQVGRVLRKGIMVDLWFDIKWTAATATAGNMYIDLPYKVAVTEQKPFVGIVQPSGFAFTAGTDCVANAQSNTYILDIYNTGNGTTSASQGSVSAGQLIGYIRYAGQRLERD